MPKKILITEDEPTTVAIVKRKLEEAGYAVAIARNGEEGLRVVYKESIDLIVTDVIMPIMDGVDFYKELKSKPKTARIPIIIITDKQVFRDSFKALGVQYFVPKPLNAQVLLQQIEFIFRQQSMQQKRGQVVIAGPNLPVVKRMGELLEADGCKVTLADDGADLLAKILHIKPEILLVDVLMEDFFTREIIKALRSFSSLRDLKILTYTHFGPDELGNVDTVEQLRESKDACNEAGATKYIGRFTSTTFIDTLREFWPDQKSQ